MLVAARFIQGVGGAMTSAVILGMIVTMFPEPRDQAKAIGVFGFVASAGGSIGLLAGGVLTESINWHWIFFINVPIGIATAVARAAAARADDKGIGFGARRRRARAPLLITAALMLRRLHDRRAGRRRRLGLDAARSGSAPSRWRCWPRSSSARRARPTRWCRCGSSARATSSGANIVQALLVVGMFGMFFLGALYLQRVLGYDALQIGLAFLPATLVMGDVLARLLGAR